MTSHWSWCDVSFASLARTANQSSTGRGIDALPRGYAVWNTVALMSNENAVRRGLDLLSGEIHASALARLFEEGRFPRLAFAERLRLAAGTDPGSAFWARGHGSSADRQGGRNAAALEQHSEGLLLGLDGPLGDWRVDFQAGENGCDAGRDGSTGHGRTDRGKDKGLTQAFEIGARSGGLDRLAVALCVVAARLVLTTSIGLMPRDAPVSLKQATTTTLAWKNLAALAFLLLAVRLLRGIGLGLRWPDWRTLGRLLWFPLLHLAAMAALVGAAGQGMQAVAIHVMVNVIAIGIAEELAFRGVLWGAPRRAMPFWPAFLAVSGIFGIAHMADVAGTGDMQGGIVQSVAAVLSGTGWLALRIRCRSLVPAMALHCLWNILVLGFGGFGGFRAPEDPAVALPFLHRLGVSVGFVLPMFFYGLWLVRNETLRAGRRHDQGR